jgi:surfeit locus 1 family protein
VRRSVLFGITVLVALAAVALGIWQLDRLKTRRAANREAGAARAQPPIVLDEAGASPAANRRATLRGSYQEESEFLLRGRVLQGVPAVQVVTPLRMSGRDTAVLVNRGYVPAPDAANPEAATWSEPGPVEVRGVLMPIPDRGDGAPVSSNGRETWRALDLTAIRRRLPFPIAAFYLVAEADSTSLEHTVRGKVYPIRAELPALTDGPHLSYAIQWFGIAAAAIAFGLLFIRRGNREWGVGNGETHMG